MPAEESPKGWYGAHGFVKGDHRCSERQWGRGRGFGGSPCDRRGKVQRDGKWFCGVCDPERRKAKLVALQAKWDAERKAKQHIAAEAEKRNKADAAVLAAADAWYEESVSPSGGGFVRAAMKLALTVEARRAAGGGK